MLHQQQELERLESKLDGSLSQLHAEIEKLGTEMRTMFEQLMAKNVTHLQEPSVVVTSSGVDGIGSS